MSSSSFRALGTTRVVFIFCGMREDRAESLGSGGFEAEEGGWLDVFRNFCRLTHMCRCFSTASVADGVMDYCVRFRNDRCTHHFREELDEDKSRVNYVQLGETLSFDFFSGGLQLLKYPLLRYGPLVQRLEVLHVRIPIGRTILLHILNFIRII